MKIGTILLNKYVSENHPFRYSIYTGQSNGKASAIYPFENGINNCHFYTSDIGESKGITPVGYIDFPNILKNEINKAINETEIEI